MAPIIRDKKANITTIVSIVSFVLFLSFPLFPCVFLLFLLLLYHCYSTVGDRMKSREQERNPSENKQKGAKEFCRRL